VKAACASMKSARMCCQTHSSFKERKKRLDHAVLLRGVGSDELLAQAVVAAGGAEAPRREHEPVVGPHDRGRALGPERAEAGKAGLLERPLGHASSTPQAELEADDLSVGSSR